MKGLALALAVLVTIFFGVFVALSDGNSVRGQRAFWRVRGLPLFAARPKHDGSKSRGRLESEGRKFGGLYADLQVIKEVRNAFAHPAVPILQPMTFENEDVIKICKKFKDYDPSIRG
jgi:hypothetical protein